MHKYIRSFFKFTRKAILLFLFLSLIFQNVFIYAQETAIDATPSANIDLTPTPTPNLSPTLTPTLSPTPEPIITPEATPSATPSIEPTTTPSVATPAITPQMEFVLPTVQPTPTATQEINPSQEQQPTLSAIEALNRFITTSSQSADLLGIKIKLPFKGNYTRSQNFGSMPENRWLENQYLKLGLRGHDGIDYELPAGTEVVASYDGVVLTAGPGIYGITVVIGHAWGMTYYGHLSETLVIPGQTITTGQIIGHSGNTGLTTGPHLHFSLKPKNPDLRNGYFGMIDPSIYLDGKPQTKVLGVSTRRKRGHKIKNFKTTENPEIDYTISDKNLHYKLVDPEGKPVKIPKKLGKRNNNKYFTVEAKKELKPGKYTLILSNDEGEQETKEFSWGVLAINLNKAAYQSGEIARLSMAVLDDGGEMVCKAYLQITVTDPQGKKTSLSTEEGTIRINQTICNSKETTVIPDYEADYPTGIVGTYQVALNAETPNGERELISSFEVVNELSFSVERISATRLYPENNYPMIFAIKPNTNFEGQIKEEIPQVFTVKELPKEEMAKFLPGMDLNSEEIVNFDSGEYSGKKNLTWNVAWEKDHTYYLGYYYDAPNASPAYYEIGPLRIGQGYIETRSWQLAIDATTTVDFSSCASGNTCDTSTTYWASDDDVDVFPFANNIANINNHVENADADYTALSASDDSRQASANPGSGDEILMWFEMPISETPSTISQIDFTYEGSTTSTANFQIVVKDDSVSAENDVAWVEVGAAESITASTETSFTRSLTGTDFSRFIDANGVITWAVYENISAVVVSTDYVKLDVITNTVEQEGFRFRNDDGSESSATWLAAQDTNITQPTATNTRLRMILNDTAGGDQATTQYQLEYKLSSDTVYRPVQASSGSIAYSANGTSSGSFSSIISITAPPTVDRGDLLVMGIANKYPTNGPTTPTGWTAITNNQATGGAGSAGVDSGNVYSTVFVREAEGWEDGVRFDVDIPSANSSEGQIIRFTKGTGKEWDLAATTGSDDTQDATWSVTASSNPDITAGDIMVTVVAANSDAAGWSGHSLTAAGISGISTTERSETASGAGDQTELIMITHTIGSGTATGAPTHTATISASVAGAAVFLRLRQVDAPIQLSASSNITASGENTTAQLTAPSGSPTFTAGRIQDDENPADTIDINDSQYTEMEWSTIATTNAANGEIYQFRVTANGTVLTTYTVTPQWTIGGGETYNQPHFRIRNGDVVGLNTDNDWAAFLDGNTTINAGGRFRVRFEVEETSGLGTSKSFTLQYRWKPNGGSYGGWANAPDRSVAGEDGPIQVLDSYQYADGDAASTNLLAGSSETFDAGGTGEENRNTGALTISNEHAEYEFTLMIRGTYGGPTRVKDGDSLELRMVESDGTAFNGTYVNPTITVEMPDYYIGSPTTETPGRIGPFKDANDNLYFFIEPTFVTGAGNNEPEMLKSTDGGKSWDLVGTSGSPTVNDVESTDVYQSGDTLHICIQSGGTNDPVTYHTFRLSDHSTDPDTWGITDESVDSSPNPDDQSCGIVKRSDGTIVIFYRYVDNGFQRVGYKIRSTGGTWGSRNGVDDTASTSFVFSGSVLGASDKAHVFYKDDTNNILYHKSLSSSDVLSSAGTVETDAEADPDDWGSAPPIYWDDNGNEKIMILVRDNSSGHVNSVVITNDGTPETRKAVAETNVRHDPPGTTHEQLVTDIVVDPETKTQYALFVPTSDSDLYMDTANNDGGWTTDVKLKTLTSGEYIRGQVITNSTGNGGNKVYGYVYEDDGLGDAGFSWYSEVALNPKGHSFQRKTWHDGTRYWRSSYDGISSLIKFEYSTDGSSWTEDTSARITSTDGNYSIEANSSNAYIAYQTGGVSNTDTIAANGLVGYWKMNESSWSGTSGEVGDASGNSFNGTASGNATTTIGKFSNSGIYDGSGDYFTVTDNSTLRPGSGSWSMSMWINPVNINQSAVIAGKLNTTTGEGYAFGMFDDLVGTAGKKITWGCRESYAGNRRLAYTSSNVVDGNWHQITGVCDSSANTIKIYVDGAEVSVTTDNAGAWPTIDDTTNFIAGQAGSSFYYNGLMDDVRVYNRALSETEITSLAKPGYDIEVKKASSYPGTGFSWGNGNVALNGSSSSDLMQYPVISIDSNSKLLVGAVNKSGSNYVFKTTRSTSVNDINVWDNPSTLDTSTNGNKYGIIIPRTSGAAYATWIDNTSIEGKNYNGTAWDGSPTSVATGITGITKSLSGTGDSSGNIHLVYIDSSNNMVYREFTSSWQTAVTLDSNTGNEYPTISMNSANSDLYAFWVRGQDIYYKRGISAYTSGDWDTSATSWKTSGINAYVSSSYSESAKVFAQWYDGTAITWDDISLSSNSAPDNPTSLVQKTTGDVTVSTGGWLNSTNVKFTASASDTDSSDTLYLCVEKDILGTPFSDTEDSCGTGVAYSGSPVTVSLTISSQTDASEYHWQARIKDAAGAYSSWVSYDVNAESARDYGLDTSAPSGGVVYDGSSAGVDSSFNDGSLSSLSANWDSFNSNVSGLESYDYSIGTTAGGTDVRDWTSNSTSTSVTASGLTLQTSQIYYFNVRANDNAGNSSIVSSDGQMIQPSLAFSIDSSSLSFSNLNTGNSYTDTKNTVITTSTNAYNGFVIRAYQTDSLRSTIYPSTTIPDFSAGSYSAPSSWSGNGFGYTSSDTSIQGSAKFPSSGSCLGTGTAPCFAPFSSTGPGDIVADHTSNISGSPVSNEEHTLTYKVSASDTQPAGPYSTSVVYTVTAQY